MLDIVPHRRYWAGIHLAVQEIADQFGDYTTTDVWRELESGGARLVLDPHSPDEYYIIMVDYDARGVLIWQGYSKKGGFLKRTLRELELLCERLYGTEVVYFTTVREHLFDKQIERGDMSGWKKQPTMYRKEVTE